MGKIINCAAIADRIKSEVKAEVETLIEKPCLAVVIVGDDPASQVYVRNKERVCEEVGIDHRTYRLPEDTSQDVLEKLIDTLNKNPYITGILVQLPLPKHLNEQAVIDLINPFKDVDGLTTHNAGLLSQGRIDEAVIPCTPMGVMEIFKEYNYDLTGKDVVIVGRSNLFGKPMAQLALNANATPIICHSKTDYLEAYTRFADVVICAIGKPKYFKRLDFTVCDFVIDVGINRDENDKLCGDVDTEEVINGCKYITPVPRGVGLLTVASLMKNVLKCYHLQFKGE